MDMGQLFCPERTCLMHLSWSKCHQEECIATWPGDREAKAQGTSVLARYCLLANHTLPDLVDGAAVLWEDEAPKRKEKLELILKAHSRYSTVLSEMKDTRGYNDDIWSDLRLRENSARESLAEHLDGLTQYFDPILLTASALRCMSNQDRTLRQNKQGGKAPVGTWAGLFSDVLHQFIGKWASRSSSWEYRYE